MDDEFLISTGVDESEVYFYTNLILNTQCMIDEMCKKGSFIDHISINSIDDGDRLSYMVDFITSTGKKSIEGLISFDINSFIFKNYIIENNKSVLTTDEFTIMQDDVIRDSKDENGKDKTVKITLYDEEELSEVLSMIAESKYHRICLNDINEEQATIFKERESSYDKKLLLN